MVKNSKGHKGIRLSFSRRAVIASASVTREKNAIHSFAEVDISEPRARMKKHYEATEEKLSLTAYVVTCLAQTIKDFPEFNSFIRGRKLIVLDDITISVLVEREIEGEKVPEPLGIMKTQEKSLLEIQDEIVEAKDRRNDKLGSLSDNFWFGLIPSFLLKGFIRIADRNIKMSKRYGKVAVTSVGMFCKEPIWFIPHGSATVLLTIGSIGKKVVEIGGQFCSHEHLCLTASFDHNIVDGAPASRFMNELLGRIKSGDMIPKS